MKKNIFQRIVERIFPSLNLSDNKEENVEDKTKDSGNNIPSTNEENDAYKPIMVNMDEKLLENEEKIQIQSCSKKDFFKTLSENVLEFYKEKYYHYETHHGRIINYYELDKFLDPDMMEKTFDSNNFSYGGYAMDDVRDAVSEYIEYKMKAYSRENNFDLLPKGSELYFTLMEVKDGNYVMNCSSEPKGSPVMCESAMYFDAANKENQINFFVPKYGNAINLETGKIISGTKEDDEYVEKQNPDAVPGEEGYGLSYYLTVDEDIMKKVFENAFEFYEKEEMDIDEPLVAQDTLDERIEEARRLQEIENEFNRVFGSKDESLKEMFDNDER